MDGGLGGDVLQPSLAACHHLSPFCHPGSGEGLCQQHASPPCLQGPWMGREQHFWGQLGICTARTEPRGRHAVESASSLALINLMEACVESLTRNRWDCPSGYMQTRRGREGNASLSDLHPSPSPQPPPCPFTPSIPAQRDPIPSQVGHTSGLLSSCKVWGPLNNLATPGLWQSEIGKFSQLCLYCLLLGLPCPHSKD